MQAGVLCGIFRGGCGQTCELLSVRSVPMQYLSPFPGFRKSRMLSRREEELRHALRNSPRSARLERTAERVRTAKLRLLKALRHSVVPYCAEDAAAAETRLRNIESESHFWKHRTVDSIINEYSNAETQPGAGADAVHREDEKTVSHD